MATAESYELKFKYAHDGLDGFDKASSGVRNVKGEYLLYAQAIGTTAAAIAAGTAAMVAFVKSQADAQRQLAITAAGMGLTAQQGQQVQAAFNAAGVSMGVMESAARQLNSRNLETDRTLKALGVTTTDVTGRQRAAGLVFIETASKIAQIRSESERSRAAISAFGSEGAAALEPILRTGKLLGPALDEGITKNLERARLEIGKLDAEWEQFKTTFGGALAPIIIPVIAAAREVVNPSGAGGRSVSTAFAAGGDVGAYQGGDAVATLGLTSAGAQSSVVASAGFAADAIIGADLAAGRAASAAFLNGTPEGLRIRQSQLGAEIAALGQRLASGGITGSSAAAARLDLDQKVRELESVKARLKRLAADPNEGALKLSDLQRPGGFRRPGLPPSLLGPLEVFRSPESDRRGVPASEFEAAIANAQIAGISENDSIRRGRSLDREQTTLSLESARIRLIAGPGGEEDAVKRITDLRLQSLERQIALGAEIKDAELERFRIAREGELELLELQQRRSQQYRDFFGQAVLAGITRGDGGGLAGFGRAQARTLLGQVSTNAGGLIFDKVGPILSRVFGTDGTSGNKAIDTLLSGTIFDPKNSAQDRNTQALDRLTNTLIATRGGVSGGVAGIPGAGVFSGAIDAAGLIFSARGGTGLPAGLPDPQVIASNDASATLGLPIVGASNRGFSNQYGSKALTGAVYAGAGVAGYLGVRGGIEQGGAKGGLNAIAAGAGAVAAISPEPISKAVASAIAVGATVASTFIPDPKTKFSEAQDRLLKERRYVPPTGLNITQDFNTGGSLAGYDMRGMPRVTVMVQTMDSKSFQDNAWMIADAVRVAVSKDHPLRSDLATIPFNG